MVKTYKVSRNDIKKKAGIRACTITKDGQIPTIREKGTLIAVLKKMLYK